MSRELEGKKDVCYICGNWPPKHTAPNQPLMLIRLWDYKRELYVHPSCALNAVMEDMRLRTLKEAWRNVFE